MTFVIVAAAQLQKPDSSRFITCITGAGKQDVRLYWKNDKGERFGNIANLKTWLARKKQRLVFAMNGGMYRPDHSPVGLYIEQGKRLSPIDTANGSGNFYLKPNGVFYITQNHIAGICITSRFRDSGNIQYATQSGPMLLVDSNIHPAFTKGSSNKVIRNGVGSLPGNKLVFVLSKEPVSFYELADYFKSLGCKNALYLDGFVSRMYLPEKNWVQTDGDFGVMIGASEKESKKP